MRPSYGLTKERSKDRIIGTFIGAAVAFGIVLVTHNTILYGISFYFFYLHFQCFSKIMGLPLL
jgi:uncharacterized membrane protein YccC